MVPRWFVVAVSVAAVLGALLWGRSALVRRRFLSRMEHTSTDPDVRMLAAGDLARDVHAVVVYLSLALAAGWSAVVGPDDPRAWWGSSLVAVPLVVTIALSRYARRDARLAEQRLRVEQRAREVLVQADVAPVRWAERLSPATLPDTPGYEVGTLHEAGTGVMSGDLLDVFHLPTGRLCCVVGDVSGHDVEASITALQTKFLLRSYLRRYRDPGQALEELNRQLSDYERPEEFVSLCVLIFDDEAATLRWASAGHPAAWLCQDRAVRPLRSTGPVLMMDRDATYLSREEPFAHGDVVVALTDGLAEARSGDQFFGEERIAGTVRRTADAAPQVVCKALLDAAAEFSEGPLLDDVTLLAVRRTR